MPSLPKQHLHGRLVELQLLQLKAVLSIRKLIIVR